LQITLTGNTKQRGHLVEALENFCTKHSLDPQVRHAADLALEEHLTNVATHGGAHEMVVQFRVDSGFLTIEVEDDGVAFDPSSRPPVDTSIPLEQKPIGGLGIHLMRQFLDELSYTRRAGRNVLRMKKRIVPSNS
jgi:serine/threonine-protein kinase RsbW